MDWQKEAERLRDLLGRYAVQVAANEGVDFTDGYGWGGPSQNLLTPQEADEIVQLKQSRAAYRELFGA